MDSDRTTNLPGSIAPADGNVPTRAQARVPRVVSRQDVGETDDEVADNFDWMEEDGGAKSGSRHGIGAGVETVPVDPGPNNERLADVKPKLVNALRELVRQYREEGIAARRHEIRRIRQARLFWQGLRYAWWNPNDMNWHLPFEQKFNDDRALEEMPRYQFVTNFYQGFGLSFIAVLSQDVPSVRFYPQSAQSLMDISAARAASDVAALIEQNNHIEQLLTSIGYFLWTDGKLGAYVRYVADGQRFGFHDENILEALEIPLGRDVYVCAGCGKETAADSAYGVDPEESLESSASGTGDGATGTSPDSLYLNGSNASPGYGSETGGESAEQPVCAGCSAQLREKDLRRAERVSVPRVTGTRRVPNGQEVISIAGGLELNTPILDTASYKLYYVN